VSLETERSVVDQALPLPLPLLRANSVSTDQAFHFIIFPPQECRKRTASWVRTRHGRGAATGLTRSAEGGAAAEDIESLSPGAGGECSFYERLEEHGTGAMLAPGVYTLEELKSLGRQKGWCAEKSSRHRTCNRLPPTLI
jgi:hypothetical protein